MKHLSVPAPGGCQKIFPLLLVALLSAGCLKQFSPAQAMSSPAVSRQGKLADLLAERDPALVAPAPSPTPEVKEEAPLPLSLQEAILSGLEHNHSFQVERLKPAVSRANEEVERATFDPLLTAQASRTHGQSMSRALTTSHTGTTISPSDNDSETTKAAAGLQQPTPLGATIELNGEHDTTDLHDAKGTLIRQQSWDLTITQSLLRGRGPEVTLARLRQARIDTEISLYELQGAAEALVDQIEQAYWAFVLAERSLAIYQQSLVIAKQQVEEVNERIKVGALAESESAAALAEEAERAQQLVTAQASQAKARLSLIHLVNPGGAANWQSVIKANDVPEMPDLAIDTVEEHVALALRQRADLNQARLLVRRRALEVTRTKNGLLPKLDLFVSLGGSRYSDSFATGNDLSGHNNAYAGGLTLELPLINREAKAKHASAGSSLEQANAALNNMEQLVQVDVRSAHVEVEQAAALVKASETTSRLRQQTLALEQEKFRLGRSTTLLVAQAQRDLVESQINQIKAVIAARQALLSLHRLEGSLLAHKGIGE